MSTIVLRPGNPHDFDDGRALEELARVLRETDPGSETRVERRDERGYGVTFTEVLEVSIEVTKNVAAAGGAAAAVKAAIEWTRQRWQRDKEASPEDTPRPRVVRILGPDGRPIRTVEIDEPEGTPADVSGDAS